MSAGEQGAALWRAVAVLRALAPAAGVLGGKHGQHSFAATIGAMARCPAKDAVVVLP
jgi:hypothetical protein